MQEGSVIREHRKLGPDVWSYRWWESGPNANIRLPETADGQRCGITSDLQPEFKGRQIDWHIGRRPSQ